MADRTPPLGEVIFVGAGPGDPRLITVAGRDALEAADVVLYAGSLVNPKLLEWAVKAQAVHDTAAMSLDQTTDVCLKWAAAGKLVVRLHTGDPSLYGAIREQLEPLVAAGVKTSIIPGVSSAFASAAALGVQLTEPGGSQTVIFTRLSGRTPVPEEQRLEKLAATNATVCVFLSIDRIEEVVKACATAGRAPETPAAAVCRASWPDERLVRGTLADLAERVREAGFERQTMIIIGEPVAPVKGIGDGPKSLLYDATFTHGFRKGEG